MKRINAKKIINCPMNDIKEYLLKITSEFLKGLVQNLFPSDLIIFKVLA
jgi:hypothetical protein